MVGIGRLSCCCRCLGTALSGYGAVFALAGIVGCEAIPKAIPKRVDGLSTYHPIGDVPLDPDIVEIKKFMSTVPWLSFDPNNRSKPGGFKVMVYPISAKTGRGVFGDGIIHVVMSMAERDENGRKVYRQIRSWSLTPEEAYPYRIKKKNPVLGYAYGLRCRWEPEDDVVLGREISIRVDFERRDGRVLTSQPNILKPPMIE